MKRNSLLMALAIIVILWTISCQGRDGEDNDNTSCQPANQVLFDSGRGNGEYDQMTYWHYYSLVKFTPSEKMTVTTVIPDFWYCNGECYYEVAIYGEDDAPQTMGNWQGTDYTLAQADLEQKIVLEANVEYYIYEHAWTDMSVGIFTAGFDHPNSAGLGDIQTIFAQSDSWDHTDRGAVGFMLVDNSCQ